MQNLPGRRYLARPRSMERFQCKLRWSTAQSGSSCGSLLLRYLRERHNLCSSETRIEEFKLRVRRPKDCARHVYNANKSSIEDPLIPFNMWTLGNPCPLPVVPRPGSGPTVPLSLCHIEKFPAYVVNASTVKHIQLAVNFARNNNIRLTIK